MAAAISPRVSLAAVSLNNKIHAFGGNNGGALSINEQYDPVNDPNTWTTETDMPVPRQNLAAAVANGRIFVIGGASSSDATVYPSCTEYVPGRPVIYMHKKN